MVRTLPLTALLVALTGCGPTAYDRARRDDTPEAWSRFLRERPADPMAAPARRRLAELEFGQARRQNSILAYKRFLAAFPSSERRKDAEVLLENLRFEVASKADTSVAWNEFLRDHPAGVHAAAARGRLDEADYREALADGSARALAEYLARHPDSPHRLQADKQLDDQLYAEARAAGPRSLVGYLERSVAGAHRDEARGALAAREAQARAWLGDFPGARRAAELIHTEAERARALAELAVQELDQLTAALDPRPVGVWAFEHEGALAEEAKARAGALSRSAPLKALAERLNPAHFARPAPELVRVLGAPDPRDRWLAAEELGRMGARDAVDALLDAAAGSRFARVRARAFAALQALYAPLPLEVREIEVRARLEGLRKVAQSPALQIKIALLEDLLGEEALALASYQKSVRGDVLDLLPLRRLLALRARRGEGFGVAVAARELATRVRDLVEQRAGEEGLSPLLLSRTLCGARDEAEAAGAALRALPARVAQDFPEDLQLFTRRAEEALRLASARLSDAEAQARAADPGFEGCEDDDGIGERLAAGEADRLRTVGALAARPEPLVRHALELVARRDPSEKVREAARAALQRRAGR